LTECGYQCNICIQELSSTLKTKEGVFEAKMVSKEGISLIAVEYDSEIIGIEDLLNELRKLPSFYAEFFIPEVWKKKE
jgi:hypothetical protein